MELHREFRPQTFDEFFGNEALVKSLKTTIGRKHVYLFHGDRGCGKTTLARLLANELKIGKLDLFELNAADATGVDDARQILAYVPLLPTEGDRKMYIIDEVHRFTANAQDALLKVLEEPPDHVYFVLCTTNVGKVAATLKSRCGDAYKVSRLKRKEVMNLVDWVGDNIELKLETRLVKAIAQASDGIPRESLVLLDLVREMEDVDEAIELLDGGISTEPELRDLCSLLLKQGKNKWNAAREILADLDLEPETVRRGILGYMSKVVLNSESADHAANLMEEFIEPFYDTGKPGLVLAVYRACLL